MRASLLIDPAELRESESVRAETAMKASRIAAQMSAYMSGRRVAEVAAADDETTTMNVSERPGFNYHAD